MNCLLCSSSSNQDRDFLFETKYWQAFLADEQSYLGRSLVVLKRHIGSLSELSEEEAVDFFQIAKELEKRLKIAFGATMFNWTCFMNDAYQEKPYNPHLHWHIRPRYDHAVELFGVKFSDPDFGKHYDRARKDKVSESVFGQLVSSVREN